MNIQQIYGIKKKKRLEKITPPKSSKKVGAVLDVEGESKPIVTKQKHQANIFQSEDPLNDLGIGFEQASN